MDIWLAMKVVTKLLDVRVVCKFPDVFSEELSRLPLDREIEIEIEFLLGTTPISKAPYRMTLVELEELKLQLHFEVVLEKLREKELYAKKSRIFRTCYV